MCAWRVASSLPVAVSHNFKVLSKLAVATVLPSGEKVTNSTQLVCPRKTARSFFVATSHSLAVWSRLAVTRPAGEGNHVANIFGLVSLADGMFICFGAGTKDDIAQHLNKDGDYVPVDLLPGRSTDSDHG